MTFNLCSIMPSSIDFYIFMFLQIVGLVNQITSFVFPNLKQIF